MPESIFEKFTEQDVSNWVNTFAVIVVLVCPLVGIVYGKLVGRLHRYLIIGCMLALVGPAIAFSWHLVDARTSYWDHKYQAQNPEIEPRILWPIVGTAKLDSLSNLGLLALVFVVGGTGCGVLVGMSLRWLDQRFPAQPKSVDEQSVSSSDEAVDEVERNDSSGGDDTRDGEIVST